MLRLRLRLPSLVQSNPFLPSPVSCLCLSCCLFCSSSCTLLLFCPCFPSGLSTLASPGFQPSLSLGPRWCLPLSALSCPCCLSLVCCRVWALPCFQPCIHLMPCSSCFCLFNFVALTPSDASSVPLGWCGVGRCVGARGDFRVVDVACRKFIHAILDSFAARQSFSCGSGGVRPGALGNPKRLSLGNCMAGYRASSGSFAAHGAHDGCGPSQVGILAPLPLPFGLSVPSLDHPYNSFGYIYMPTASESSDPRPSGNDFCVYFCDDFCDDGKIDDTNTGLRRAGEEHSSSLPDSASYACSTPSRFKFHLELAGSVDCVVPGDRLHVATAQGHPLGRVSLGGGGATRRR